MSQEIRGRPQDRTEDLILQVVQSYRIFDHFKMHRNCEEIQDTVFFNFYRTLLYSAVIHIPACLGIDFQ